MTCFARGEFGIFLCFFIGGVVVLVGQTPTQHEADNSNNIWDTRKQQHQQECKNVLNANISIDSIRSLWAHPRWNVTWFLLDPVTELPVVVDMKVGGVGGRRPCHRMAAGLEYLFTGFSHFRFPVGRLRSESQRRKRVQPTNPFLSGWRLTRIIWFVGVLGFITNATWPWILYYADT